MPDAGLPVNSIYQNLIAINVVVPDYSTMQVPDFIQISDGYDLKVGDQGNVKVIVS